jgi:hypothetical protein
LREKLLVLLDKGSDAPKKDSTALRKCAKRTNLTTKKVRQNPKKTKN